MKVFHNKDRSIHSSIRFGPKDELFKYGCEVEEDHRPGELDRDHGCTLCHISRHCCVIGVAWPSWVSELTNRLKDLTLETRGRGEALAHTAADNYFFFQRKDSPKRQSFLTWQRSSNNNNAMKKKNKTATPTTTSAFAWPWAKPQRVRRPPCKEEWGGSWQRYAMYHATPPCSLPP